MKRTRTALALLGLTSACSIAAASIAAVAWQDSATPPTAAQPAQQIDHHAWLQQLVGEWTIVAEAEMGEGMEPMRMEGTETVRAIGDLWIVGDMTGEFMGEEMKAVLTLGYDPNKEKFVGTWIDEMTPYLWTYTGTLDVERNLLTLESEGPSFGDPSVMAKYRETIQLKNPDLRAFTSSVQLEDGTWMTFMTAEYTRTK